MWVSAVLWVRCPELHVCSSVMPTESTDQEEPGSWLATGSPSLHSCPTPLIPDPAPRSSGSCFMSRPGHPASRTGWAQRQLMNWHLSHRALAQGSSSCSCRAALQLSPSRPQKDLRCPLQRGNMVSTGPVTGFTTDTSAQLTASTHLYARAPWYLKIQQPHLCPAQFSLSLV